ncbi:flavoprotein-like protein [Aspergillus falconensis]
MAPKIAIVFYSMYGQIKTLAEAEARGIKAVGGQVDIYQKFSLKMYAPPKSEYAVAVPDTLKEYDTVLFGVPTRFGNFPAQWKAFWDATGGIWAAGYLAHHGTIYVPLGYKTVFSLLSNIDELRGGSPWGEGTFVGADGSWQPTEIKLNLADEQGKALYEAVSKVSFASGRHREAHKSNEGPCGLPKCTIL